MMYQTTSSYQPEINNIQYNQGFNVAIQPTIQMFPYVQQISQQHLPVQCSPDGSATQLPMFPPMPVNDYRSHSATPISYSPQITSWNANHQFVPPMTLDNEAVYNCSYLGQLQGSYEIETSEGQDQVSVIVPTVAEGGESYAIVRRVCSDGEALPDQFIYQEPTRFTLCCVDGNVEAQYIRGSNMRYTVKWESTCDGSQTVWRRKGEVTFNLVPADSLAPSRRNSISSTCTSSTNMSSVQSSLVGPNGMPMYIRPELQRNSVLQSRNYLGNSTCVGNNISNDGFKPYVTSNETSNTDVQSGHQEDGNSTCVGNNISNDGFQPYVTSNETSNTDVQRGHQEEAMFELIKAHCVGNSSLLKRIVHWGMKNRSMRRTSPEDVSTLSEGRVWVTAHLADLTGIVEIDDCLQESLDDIKGAYREIRTGVYKQPEPQVNEPGAQHRLMKDSHGYWKIEAHDVDSGKWILCAQELPDGLWMDMKNNRKDIRVKIIPMGMILEKMSEEFASENQKVEKSMEFLFTNCNQKKLNSKLRGSNLKHNISNLKVKLEKQYALRFAVQVATTGDSIAQEMDVSR